MNLDDLGNIGELVGAIATVATLVYLAIQIRHNSRGLEQNSELMRLSFENHLRKEGTEFRSLVASDGELTSIWRRGLAAAPDLTREDQDRFELLIVNLLNMLTAEFDGRRRGIARGHRSTYLFYVARTAGFRRWWEHRRGIGMDDDFVAWIDALLEGEAEPDLPIA